MAGFFLVFVFLNNNLGSVLLLLNSGFFFPFFSLFFWGGWSELLNFSQLIEGVAGQPSWLRHLLEITLWEKRERQRELPHQTCPSTNQSCDSLCS